MGIGKKIRQFYGDMKLQSKFTLTLMLAVSVPVLMLGLFFYGRLYEMVISYTIKQEQDSSAETSPLIDEIVSQVKAVSDSLSEQPFYSLLFHSNPEGLTTDELAGSQEAADFQEFVETVADQTPVTAVRIYIDFPQDSPLFSGENTRELFLPVNYAKGTYWYGIFQGSQPQELYCPSFYLGSAETEDLGDMAYIHRASFSYQDNSYDAYVAVYYSSSQLIEILQENLALEGSVSYIINDRDAVVAASDTSLSGIYWLSYETIEDSVMSSNNFIERNILGLKVYAGFYRIGAPGWFMVTVLPEEPMIAQGNQMMVQFVTFYALFLLLALLLASFLSRSITGRISSVSSQMKKVRQGPPVPMESPVYHDEVGDLIDTYNYMTRKMNQLMEEQAKAAEDLRIAEFNSLQAQINPHFLYNTMDMINWMAQQGRTAEIRNAVQNLSRFYKLTLSRKQSISTIAQEVEHVSIYVTLQNMRFHDSIEFISDIPDELSEYPIPKLTLQPVVENAILHGILEKPAKVGTIVLTGWMEDGDIVLLVSDDGVGIDEETLGTILDGKGKSGSGGTNIAIYNTHRRLQILYGERYGLAYESSLGKGTEVMIRVPGNPRG